MTSTIKHLGRTVYRGDRWTLSCRGESTEVAVAKLAANPREITLAVNGRHVVLKELDETRLRIGGDLIAIRVHEIRSQRARLIFAAPDSITIDRRRNTA